MAEYRTYQLVICRRCRAEISRRMGRRDMCECDDIDAKYNPARILITVADIRDSRRDQKAGRRAVEAALRKIVALQKRWDAPAKSDDVDASNRAWAAVGSEAHKIAVDALAQLSPDRSERRP